LVLLVAVLLAGLSFMASRVDGWRFGESVLHSIVCAVAGDCGQEGALERAYGGEVAELVRKYSPNVAYERRSAQLPIDFRRCRKLECSNGPDDPREVARSSAGLPVTAFTRVIDHRPSGGALYLQYWFYYPESFTAGIGRDLGRLASRLPGFHTDSTRKLEHRWPGYHADDWEGYQVRVGGGLDSARASAHGGYGDGWKPWTGWYRVSGGSHAGQLTGGGAGERTTRSAGLELVPLEPLGRRDLSTFTVAPPWRKDVYTEPESASS
jgi:hypothetical protein